MIFIYDKLINPATQQSLNIKIINPAFALIKGKIYNHLGNPVVFTENLNKFDRIPAFVLGVVCKFTSTAQDIPRVLDAYYGCSLSELNINSRNDLFHRVKLPVEIVHFDTLDDLRRWKYSIVKETTATVYVGNKKAKTFRNISKTKRCIDAVNKEFLIDYINHYKRDWLK